MPLPWPDRHQTKSPYPRHNSPVAEAPEGEEIASATEACRVAEAHAVRVGSAEEPGATVGAAQNPAVRAALPAWAAVGAGVVAAVAEVVAGEEEGNKVSFHAFAERSLQRPQL